MILAKAKEAKEALKVVEYLQTYFADSLYNLSKEFGSDKEFVKKEWLRDGGDHGGGSRYEAVDESLFNRGSINVSQVHYDDLEDKKLNSATAISTIIHPKNPNLPSIHMHISYTDMRRADSYWRIMVDLNPSVVYDEDKKRFEEGLKQAVGDEELLTKAKKDGDEYFYIPALKRTRGVSHFYLEGYKTESFDKDKEFAKEFGKTMIDTYIDILKNAINTRKTITDEQKKEQLDYHTLYLFQVLTLDRGTTSGVLVHNQNDVGIMGSIPSHIDTDLLKSWIEFMPKPQDKLLEAIIDVLGEGVSLVDDEKKQQLANVLREHYSQYPESLKLQAKSNLKDFAYTNHQKV